MRLAIYSDLHNEFEPFEPDLTLLGAMDLIVLAGDIDTRHHGVAWARQWAQTIPAARVLMVAGNHEFYGGHFDRTLVEMRTAAAGTNIHVLENDQMIVNGVRFLGCTLWTDFELYGQDTSSPQAIETIRNGMTDYRRVTAGGQDSDHTLHPRDTQRRHRISQAWLESRLAEPFPGATVVITHHAPSVRSIPAGQAGKVLNGAYASDLESMMGKHVPLWIHGHIHETLDYQLNGTRVLCNPRGYSPRFLNKNFNCALVVCMTPDGKIEVS